MSAKQTRKELLAKIRTENAVKLIQARVRGILGRKFVDILKDKKKATAPQILGNDCHDSKKSMDGVAQLASLQNDQQNQPPNESHNNRADSKDECFAWPSPLEDNFESIEDKPNFDNHEHVIDWVYRTKTILIRTVTWNLYATLPSTTDNISKILIPPNRFHVYIVGTEECERSIAQSALITSKKNWEQYLRDILGPSYLAIRSTTLQATHIVCFVHVAISNLISGDVSAAVATGMGNVMGNKGGVGIGFNIGRTSFLFVNAHLSAHQNAVQKRNEDFARINREMPIVLSRKKFFEHQTNSVNASETADSKHLDCNEVGGTSKDLKDQKDSGDPLHNDEPANVRKEASGKVLNSADLAQDKNSAISADEGKDLSKESGDHETAATVSSGAFKGKGTSSALSSAAAVTSATSLQVGGLADEDDDMLDLDFAGEDPRETTKNEAIGNGAAREEATTATENISQMVAESKAEAGKGDQPSPRGPVNALAAAMASAMATGENPEAGSIEVGDGEGVGGGLGLSVEPVGFSRSSECDDLDQKQLPVDSKHGAERDNNSKTEAVDGMGVKCVAVPNSGVDSTADAKVDVSVSVSDAKVRVASPRLVGANNAEDGLKTGGLPEGGDIVGTKKIPQGLHECADRVVFMGDLNYRIQGTRAMVQTLMDKKMHEVLLNNDQLKSSMAEGLVLQHFTEAPLNFMPTYKLDPGTDDYDTGKKQRIPAWTDRILYVEAGMQCTAYNADFSLKTSDHRPVYASFAARVDVDESRRHMSKIISGRGGSDDSGIQGQKLLAGADEPGGGSSPPQFVTESQVCSVM